MHAHLDDVVDYVKALVSFPFQADDGDLLGVLSSVHNWVWHECLENSTCEELQW